MEMLVEADIIREAIDRFKVFAKPRLLYTGRVKNATKLAKPFPLFQAFVSEHEDFWLNRFCYKHTGSAAGTLAPPYKTFLDYILLASLSELGREEGYFTGNVRFMYRKFGRKNGGCPPRCILGWEAKIES